MALNTITCTTAGGGNTGYGDCYLDPSFIRGAFIVPKSLALTASEVLTSAALITKLQTLSLSAEATRIYPISDFQQITDNSEDVTIGTLGYGGKSVTKEGEYDWAFQFFKGGLCLNKALRKFNGKDKAVLFFDDKGVVFGTRVGDTIKGIPLSLLYTAPFKINDGSNKTIYTIRFSFPASYLNDSPGFTESSLAELDTVDGIQDVALSSGGARVTNVSKVKGTVGCGGISLASLYSSELAVVGAWVVRSSITGNLITITGVAYDANYGGWTITVDASDPDYSAGSPVVISLSSAAALAVLGVTGYESNTHTTPN